jgi:predicted molibdopterin-dependent oxidoreductase YjgC
MRVPGDGDIELRIDGTAVTVSAEATVLEACDAAGHYVPRLCWYPGLGCIACTPGSSGACHSTAQESTAGIATECGLCVVGLADGSTVLACMTPATPGLEVITDSAMLRSRRVARLAAVLDRHPHVCLGCPDAEGCDRDGCTYGNPPEARCCDRFGRCELGKLVEWLDPGRVLPRRPVTVSREHVVEGQIRREPGLCIGCGRCVRACSMLPGAGNALEMVAGAGSGVVARPKSGTLRASGCTFCGQCILVCPAGALSAAGERGVAWLTGRRERSILARPVLPPTRWQPFTCEEVEDVPGAAGVFTLFDGQGQVLLIRGVADLSRGLTAALRDPSCSGASFFQIDVDPMFTQRESELLARYAQEHGGLPAANDLDDDLF